MPLELFLLSLIRVIRKYQGSYHYTKEFSYQDCDRTFRNAVKKSVSKMYNVTDPKFAKRKDYWVFTCNINSA